MDQLLTGSFKIDKYLLDGPIYGSFWEDSSANVNFPLVTFSKCGRFKVEKERPYTGNFCVMIGNGCGEFMLDKFVYPAPYTGTFLVDINGQPRQGRFSSHSLGNPNAGTFFDQGIFLLNMDTSWRMALSKQIVQEYFLKLTDDLQSEQNQSVVYPATEHIFAWTFACSVSDVKVVILGQDPYHNGQAHGLAFSVLPGTTIRPSLRNIYTELELEGFLLPGQSPEHGYLMGWARQGVLLLNRWLTVRCGEPESHRNLGWEKFTDAVITYLNQNNDGLVFMLWGGEAKKKEKDIDKRKHTVLKARHPSPYRQSEDNTFIGNGNFLECNTALLKYRKKPVCWGYLPLD